ncbi:DUF305 domain-containing protein [Luteimonas sp. RD2P54]|uniref:DUF305 domain-containing protein n=1 Tax=Luteimonas endophytica TaxID=3042023 RepID=A0ABT6JEK3_9GAMM|nr:DUF305 domain-containing protein [Luteimonas endophytica]MDH5825037.1 DUF305 domain-containing protein [Luteimonas endophytica]
MKMSYWRFAAMIGTSTAVMFGLMYLNTYAMDHVLWSQTRAWMALLMGATMAIVMLAFMLGMYENKKVNIAIFAGSAVLFALCLWLVRSQATVDDAAYMRAMVPHHSIAILTSSRAQISDPRVRKLADEIIDAQRREIAEMKYLIARTDSAAGEVDALDEPEVAPRMVTAREAIATPQIARVDLAGLDEAEIARALGTAPRCGFSYSREAGPVVAMTEPGSGAGRAVVKIHGRLVELAAAPTADGGARLTADGIEVVIGPGGVRAGAWTEADAVLRLDAGLSVGYSGFLRCAAPPPAGGPSR